MRRFVVLLGSLLAFSAQAQDPDKALEYFQLVQQFSAAQQAGEWTNAVALGEKALAISPVDGDVWFMFAGALGRVGRYADAIPAYMQALEKGSFTNKQPAVVAFGIASANARIGNNDQALTWLRKSFDWGHRDIRLFRNAEFAALKGNKDYEDMVQDRDVATLSRNEGLAYDLWYLDREARRIHYNPYGVTSKQTLDQEYARLKADIPSLTDEQFYVRARAYVCLFGDGHTALRLNEWAAPDTRTAPIRLTKFTDGVFVTGSTDQYAHLIGAKLLSVQGVHVDDAWKRLSTLVSKDNVYDDVAQIPAIMTISSIMRGIGLAEMDEVSYALQTKDGAATLVKLPWEAAPTIKMFQESLADKPHFLQNPNKAYWFTYIEADKTLYMQYNAVRNDAGENIPAFMERLFKEAQGKPIEKFVIDVRFNGGGNSFLNAGIQDPVMRNPLINKRGTLFIITGRNTFSAAQNFTTDFNRSSEAIFVGEPTGSRPNFVGETIPVILPYTKMRMTVSDLYWQRSWPMDHRQWIPPDIPTEMSSAHFFAGRDPAMEAIRKYRHQG